MKRPADAAVRGKAEKGDKAAKADARPHRGPGEIRIIGGAWKRTRLSVPALPGLRPTPDRVRETLFNWLGQDLNGWRCMDAYAGTGALGLEAASRGAASVVLCEQDVKLIDALRKTRERLDASAVEVRRGDGLTALRQSAAAGLDLVFIDPPFDAELFASSLDAAGRAVRTDGFVYLEAPVAWTDEALAGYGLVVHRHLRAGAVHAHLLRRVAPAQVA